MSEFFVTKSGIYQITPGLHALYDLIAKYDPELVHVKLMEIQATLGYVYLITHHKDVLEQINFVKELDAAVLKCRAS